MIPTQEEQDKKLEKLINQVDCTAISFSEISTSLDSQKRIMQEYAKWYIEQVVKEVIISAVSDVYSEEDIPDYVQGDYRIDTNSCTCYYVDTQEMLNILNNKEQ